MKKSFMSLQFQLLSLIVIVALGSHVRFHLDHPMHSAPTRRHQLATRRHLIRHDMRVFAADHSHLTHDSTIENYELNDMGYFFTINLTVGGMPYRLNIDTGSSDIFIKGEKSPGKPANKYSCAQCLKRNQKVMIGYLDGTLSTYKNTLPVVLGIHTFNESILVAYTAPKNFEEAEGLVGLSFPQLARNSDPTFIQTLINNKIIAAYAFGVNLNFQQHHRSFISLGTPDTDLFKGTLKKYPISRGYSYTISVKGVSVGDGSIMSVSSALLDTGNTCISIPRQFQNDILQKFNRDGNSCGFDVEESAPQFSLLRCKVRNHDKLPSLKIYIENDAYLVDHNAYTQRCARKKDGDLCDFYIQSVRESKLFLGDGFFNRYYTYFDIANREVGFAENKEQLSYQNMFINLSEFDQEDINFFAKLK